MTTSISMNQGYTNPPNNEDNESSLETLRSSQHNSQRRIKFLFEQ